MTEQCAFVCFSIPQPHNAGYRQEQFCFCIPVSADVKVFPVAVRAFFTAFDRIISVVAKCVFAVCNQSCTSMDRSVSVLAGVAPIAGLFL